LWFFVLLLTGGIVAAVFGFLQLSNAQDGAT
jgi:hypothetical protein